MNYIENLPDFKGKKVLFLAETNYQIINCINMACHMEEAPCDLYLNSFYDNSSQIGKSLRQFAIFRNIRIYKSTQNRLIKAYNFVFLKKYIRSLFSKFEYDVILFASRTPLTRAVITFAKYYKPKTLIFSYDEGLGTYLSKMETYTNQFEKAWIKFRFGDIANMVTDKVLYEPKAYVGNAQEIRLYQMPKINKQVIDIINTLFEYSDKMRIHNKYIYFDDYYDGTDGFKRSIIKELVKITEGNLMIKKHPQTSEGMYYEGVEYPYSRIPYEVIAANDDMIDDKVLITNMSSAVWTPMLLYKKHPKIVILYPLFQNYIAKDIIDRLSELYASNKVVFIDKIDDLEKIKNE